MGYQTIITVMIPVIFSIIMFFVARYTENSKKTKEKIETAELAINLLKANDKLIIRVEELEVSVAVLQSEIKQIDKLDEKLDTIYLELLK